MLGALTGILTTSWKARKDIETAADIDLRKHRIDVYRDLWKRLETLAFFAGPRVTYEDVGALARSAREWYFQQGGLFLSERTRDPYSDVQLALHGILLQERSDDLLAVGEDSVRVLRELASRLRATMTEEVETWVGPRDRWSPTRTAGRLLDRRRPRVDVEVRTYWRWSPEPSPGYQLTVHNLSTRRTIDVIEAWFVPAIPVQGDSLLPARIRPKGKWKGWAPLDAFADPREDVGRRGRIRLSTGQKYGSEAAREFPLPVHDVARERLERKEVRHQPRERPST